MKPKIVSKTLLSLGLMLVLGSAITQVHGEDVKPGVGGEKVCDSC